MPKSKQRRLVQDPFPSRGLFPVSRNSTSRHPHAGSLPSLPCASHPLLRHLSAALDSSPLVSPSSRPPPKQHQMR